MGKHITDHANASSDGRLKQFTEIERHSGSDGSHPAAKAAHRQTLSRKDSSRTKEFARIERGVRA